MARRKYERVRLNRMGKALSGILSDLAQRNQLLFANTVGKEWPIRFRRAALDYYPSSPLRVRTGHLRRSIRGFTRREGGRYLTGLRNRMAYARYLEFGTKHIRARHFLSIPLRQEAQAAVAELHGAIGF